jgi:hypothetical protein
MTTGNATALCLGFVSAFTLGMWLGPHITGVPEAAPIAAVQPAPEIVASPSARPSAGKTIAAAPESAIPAVPATSMDLQKRLKPVLNEGMNLSIAAKGFRNGEEFAAVAHASQNLGVPFMVLCTGSSKSARASKPRSASSPDADAVKEAGRVDAARAALRGGLVRTDD